MTSILVQSVKRSKGTYEGKDYDNTVVYGFVVGTPSESWLVGPEVIVAKFKSPAFAEALERNIKAINSPNVENVKDLAGLKMALVFDRFGNCEDFILSVD